MNLKGALHNAAYEAVHVGPSFAQHNITALWSPRVGQNFPSLFFQSNKKNKLFRVIPLTVSQSDGFGVVNPNTIGNLTPLRAA